MAKMNPLSFLVVASYIHNLNHKVGLSSTCFCQSISLLPFLKVSQAIMFCWLLNCEATISGSANSYASPLLPKSLALKLCFSTYKLYYYKPTMGLTRWYEPLSLLTSFPFRAVGVEHWWPSNHNSSSPCSSSHPDNATSCSKLFFLLLFSFHTLLVPKVLMWTPTKKPKLKWYWIFYLKIVNLNFWLLK